jgi:hypothetical protein
MIDPFAREVRIASSNYAAYVAATTEASATDSRAIAYAVRLQQDDEPTGPIIEGARGLDAPGGTEP